MYSGLYQGWISHRRLQPIRHGFCYPLFMVLLDLDEWPRLTAQVSGLGVRPWHWARFRRADYLGGRGCLKTAVQDKVAELTGVQLSGRVALLGQLRYAGVYFSPLNLYYLYDAAGNWRYTLAEVSNTPWNQRHYYAVPSSAGEVPWRHDKAFHVSPFNPMHQQYRWRLTAPERRVNVSLDVDADQKTFNATLYLQRSALTTGNLVRLLVRTPCVTLLVVWRIYWQALKLWWKGASFYSHPDRRADRAPKEG